MSSDRVRLLDALEDVSRGNRKIPQSDFMPEGPLAVVDQGQALVSGYTDNLGAAVSADGPLIVFGDHTRAFKYVDFPFAMGADGVKVLRARDGFDPKFVYHYLASRQLPSAGYSRHFKFLKEVQVPKPAITEQRRIATILDNADALRAKRRQVLAHLDGLTQSIFHEMFGDSETQPLGEMCDFYSGGTPSKGDPDLWVGDLAWFSAKDLKDVHLSDSQDHISRQVLDQSSLRVLPENTVVVVVRGMILAHTLPASVLEPAATINQDLKAVLPKESLPPEFLVAAIRQRERWLLARTSASAHGTKKLDAVVLASTPIPLVSEAEVREYVRRAKAVRSFIDQGRASLEAEHELFASLQSRAFRGEL